VGRHDIPRLLQIAAVASLIFDKAGSLYGTTSHGGGYNSGSVFKLSPTRPGLWKLAVILMLNGAWNGAAPEDGLIFDGRGNLYATTAFGGECNVSGGCGVVFELQHLSDGKWKEVVEHDFQDDGTDGYWPYGGLVFGASGALYGTTIIGGAACGYYVCGTVYEVARDVKGIPHESVIHNFIGGSTDGRYPQDGLIVDSAGDLYGTAWIGPGDGPGMVFELTPTSGNAWTETILYSFTGGADGGNPIAGLTLDASGNLFGTTSIGGGGKCNGVEGPGCGVVFEVTP
jgi:uncharacterized repeat protein (TIGR03803 family)